MAVKTTPDNRGGFRKGEPRPPNAGRKKGSINKTTASVKAALEEAFVELGGVPNLVMWARKNSTEFYKLYAKLLPVQVQAKLNHAGDVRIVVETGVPRAPNNQ